MSRNPLSSSRNRNVKSLLFHSWDKFLLQSPFPSQLEVFKSILNYLDLDFIGNYDVVINEDHFFRLIMNYVQPPPVLVGDQKSLGYLVQMGFPSVDFRSDQYICLW